MDPMTMYAIGQGVNAIGQGLFGGGDAPAKANLHLVNPAQQALYNRMAGGLLNGSGDFGFGQAAKSGTSQLQDMMAQRGISPDSGIAMQAQGNMMANAMGQDAANRRDTWFRLMGQPLQTAQTAGANFIPGSPSQGVGREQQHNLLQGMKNKYGTYASRWANDGDG
jgi:hypothetical protein